MFVVFEGIDGSGKTTISNRVVKQLIKRGLSVKHVRAEGKFASQVTEAVRSLARDVKNLELVPKAEFLLYVAREVQLVGEALLPAVATHDVVIADRYLYTAEVLARFGRRVDETFINSVLEVASLDLVPDLCILVDVDPVLARARRKVSKLPSFKLPPAEVKPPSRKGLTGTGLQHRLRDGYVQLATATPERWAIIRNETNLDDAVTGVTDLIEDSLKKGVSRTLVEFRQSVPEKASVTEQSLSDVNAALTSFLAWVVQRAESEPAVAAHFLAGFWGPAVDELRAGLAERAPLAVLASASGLVDEQSFHLRDRLLEHEPGAVARSLSGISNEDPRARRLRELLVSRAEAEVVLSLSGLDDELASALRERLYEQYPNQVLASLAGLDTPHAWELRERWLSATSGSPTTPGPRLDNLSTSYELARAAVRGVRSLGSERAWEIRTLARDIAPIEALRSIVRLNDEQSFRWREQVLLRAPRPVMETLRGVASPEAWEMRKQVAMDCREAIEGFSGVDLEAAWELRELYVEVWPCSVVKSLGSLANSPRGQALLQRQLSAHSQNLNVRRHAAAIALGVQRDSNLFLDE